jgi:SAM-dependent methyltransferase
VNSRVPSVWLQRLKAGIVPLYNGTVHGLRRARVVLDALAHNRRAWCLVCGRVAWMAHRPDVVSPRLRAMWGLSPALAAALARKESTECFRCGAKLRAQRLAQALLQTVPADSPPRSIREWVGTSTARDLRIAEINRIDGLHGFLATLPHLAASDFHDPHAPTESVHALPHEDLTRLSYPDASFDLVLHSETLEHVPDLAAALREIHRVLRPGGWQLFTIPRLPGVATTFPRARLAPDGAIEVLVPPLLHHPGGEVGYPVFTEFGADFSQILEAHGFEPRERFGPPSPENLDQVWVCRKRG